VNRAALRVPAERIVVPAMRRHRPHIETDLDTPCMRVIFQPRDRGTAADVLVPAYWIRWQDPEATVVILPPDQDVAEPQSFMDHVADAVAFVQQYPRWMLVLAVDRAARASAYGCVIPGPALGCSDRGPVWRVDRYMTAPTMVTARRCRSADGFASTGVVVARAATLVDTARQLLPALHSRCVFLAPLLGSRLERPALARAYGMIPSANFSRAILEASTPILAMMRLAARWCDVDGAPGMIAAHRARRRMDRQPLAISE
jgi:mannose-1-phosphate guanylyltransferase